MGKEIIISNRKIKPPMKSIQLPKSFKKPREDLIRKKIPKIIKIEFGGENSIKEIKIKLPKMSSPPKTLISIFFK